MKLIEEKKGEQMTNKAEKPDKGLTKEEAVGDNRMIIVESCFMCPYNKSLYRKMKHMEHVKEPGGGLCEKLDLRWDYNAEDNDKEDVDPDEETRPDCPLAIIKPDNSALIEKVEGLPVLLPDASETSPGKAWVELDRILKLLREGE